MLPTTEWNLLPADPTRAAALAGHCGIDPLIAQVLLNRGLAHPADVERFFHPTLETLADPYRLPDMEKAVARIRRAIHAKQPILVFGDSDVDGITASVIVYETLEAQGGCVKVRLSNRLEDGYGFPKTLLNWLVRLGIRLLIFVDCGTNQSEEIRSLTDRGIDTIVLDHHVLLEDPAQPHALVNPHRGTGAGRGLCSAGLALKLVQALWPKNLERLNAFLDLAALGTLADYAPLVGENRTFVSVGLERLPTTPRPGLQQLCEAVGMTKPTTEQILRRVVPRLNAAGRLGDASPVFELLVARSAQRARRFVETIGHAHVTTQALHRQMISEASEHVNRIHFKDQHVVVIGRRGWHPGLMGPLAAQLMERYARPAIAIAVDERGVGVGSGRSPTTFDLVEALQACDGMLLRYGGHPQACGLSLRYDQLETFRDTINRHAHAASGRQSLVPKRQIDAEVALREVTTAVASSIEQFAPFGPGNPRPSLLLRQLRLEADAAGGSWLTDGKTRLKVRGRLGGLVFCAERYDVVASPTLAQERVVLSIGEARVSATGLS